MDHGKVFGIGLSKTGTTSLYRALGILGYSAVDFPRTPAEIDTHQAATDTSVTAQFKQLDKIYPGSKFIYTTRDLESWLQSCERFWQLHEQTIETQAIVRQVFTALYGTPEFDRDRFVQAYARHEKCVTDYFAERPGDLLVMDICHRASWPPLCKFLNKAIPKTDFPHNNSFNQAIWLKRRERAWKMVKPLVPKFIRPPVRRFIQRKG